MTPIDRGVNSRIEQFWNREAGWQRAASIAATAHAIKNVVFDAARQAASDDGSSPTPDDRRTMVIGLLRATDRMQHLCPIATGLLYTCVIPLAPSSKALQWAGLQMANPRRTESRIDALVHDMAADDGPTAAGAAAKLVKLLATAAWADPRMHRHGYHLMEIVAGVPLADLTGDGNGDLPTESEIDAMPARLDSARGGVVQSNPTQSWHPFGHPFGKPASEQ